MPHAENAVSIATPVHEVFAFVSDGTTAPRWRSGVLDVERTEGSGGVGTRYRQGVKGPGGRRVAADYEVTAYEPDQVLGFRAIAGPVRPTGRFTFTPVDGGTRVTFSLDAELRGVKKLLMERAVSKTMRAEVGALEDLRRVLEGA